MNTTHPAPQPAPIDPAAAPSPHWLQVMARHGLRTVVLGAAVAVFLLLLGGHDPWRTLLYSECISLCCWIFIDGGRVLAGTWVHRRAPMASERARARWPGWGWMTLCLVVGTVLGVGCGSAIGDWLTGQGSAGPDLRSLRSVLAILAFSLIPGIGFSYYHYTKQQLRAAEARAETARRQAAEHQLKLLESQLEPHMLFNTLANLRVLIALDAPRAQAMLDQLIAFLRATLGASRSASHPLDAEVGRLRDYLALMQVRMGERLQVNVDVPASLAAAPVPPLLLQPLVENCIKHGLEPTVAGGRIDIGAARDGSTLVLTVRDTGQGLEAARAAGDAAASHFGLQQVRDRLATLYGPAASLTLAPADDAAGGTRATVRLPLGPRPAPSLTAEAPRAAAAIAS